MAQESSSVLYLDKDRLFFFDGEKVFKLDFPPEVVRDLDVVNEENLVTLIFQFIEKAKLNPSRFILVISDAAIFAMESFEKDPGKLEAEFQNFIDLVPFDSPLARKYGGKDRTEMMATNGDLVHTICEALESRGFARDIVVPAVVFGDLGIKRSFDATAGKRIIDNISMAKGKGLLEPTILPTPENSTPVVTSTPTNSKLLPFLIGGFVLALIALVVVVLIRR